MRLSRSMSPMLSWIVGPSYQDISLELLHQLLSMGLLLRHAEQPVIVWRHSPRFHPDAAHQSAQLLYSLRRELNLSQPPLLIGLF